MLTAPTITPVADGAEIRFEKDSFLIEALKADFTRARWNGKAKAWFVPGATAEKRLRQWWERIKDEAAANRMALQEASRRIQSGIMAAAGGMVTFGTTGAAVVRTAGSHHQIRSALYGIGATYHASGEWFVPAEAVPKLAAIIHGLALVNREVAAVEAEKDREWAERRERWARDREKRLEQLERECAAREAAAAERRLWRVLMPVSRLPKCGKVIDTPMGLGVVEGFGKEFRINEDHPEFGDHLLGFEGCMGCYVYTVPLHRCAVPVGAEHEAA